MSADRVPVRVTEGTVDAETLARVYQRVVDERLRQLEKWGRQTHTLEYWLCVLGEEYGEACRAALDINIEGDPGKVVEVRDELVEAAAVAVAIISGLEDVIAREELEELVKGGRKSDGAKNSEG